MARSSDDDDMQNYIYDEESFEENEKSTHILEANNSLVENNENITIGIIVDQMNSRRLEINSTATETNKTHATASIVNTEINLTRPDTNPIRLESAFQKMATLPPPPAFNPNLPAAAQHLNLTTSTPNQLQNKRQHNPSTSDYFNKLDNRSTSDLSSPSPPNSSSKKPNINTSNNE